jgi:cytidine deaminase
MITGMSDQHGTVRGDRSSPLRVLTPTTTSRRLLMEIDWPALRAAAIAASGRAYAPYSRLQVGAAGQAADGTIVIGCNVENASFGLTLCAECGLVSALHAAGSGRLAGVSVVAADGAPMMPCGRCRQLLLEAGGPELLLDAEGGPRTLGSLLPFAFSGTDLAERRESDA